MSLREELSRRLAEVQREASQKIWDEMKRDPNPPARAFLQVGEALADEVIRQMEWARRECVESVDSFQAGNSWLQDKDLTLAPPGWEP